MEDKECQQVTLNVEKTATEAQIKKSYYKLAREFHPDKNVQYDPETRKHREERFKQISEAYEILSNEQSRAGYDKQGHEGFKEQEFADAQDLMENFLVGGEIFEMQVGKLGSNEEFQQRTQGMNVEQMRAEMKREKEEEMKKLKLKYTDTFTQFKTNKVGFINNLIQESAEICSMPANRPLLKYLGWRIQNIASQWTKDDTVFEYFKAGWHSFAGSMSFFVNVNSMVNNSFGLLISMSGEISAMQDLHDLPEDERERAQEEISRRLKEKLKENEGRMVDIATSFHILKIFSNIGEVLEQLFYDPNTKERPRMVEMFYMIGTIFLNYFDESIFEGINLNLDQHLKTNQRLYFELRETSEVYRFSVHQSNPSDLFDYMQRESDGARVWLLIKKIKFECQNQNTEDILYKSKYKDCTYIQLIDEEHSVEIMFNHIVKQFIFSNNHDYNKFKGQLKERKIKFKTKTEYEAENNIFSSSNPNNNQSNNTQSNHNQNNVNQGQANNDNMLARK